jgi:hypothetical protein
MAKKADEAIHCIGTETHIGVLGQSTIYKRLIDSPFLVGTRIIETICTSPIRSETA